ncbi:restriction endonuclease subunit S [Azospirillum argentinense]
MSSKVKSFAAMSGEVALVPKLRFPEFREAKAWSFMPMGTVYTFRGNNSLSRDKLNYSSGSFKNIHYGDIHTKFASHFDITKERVPFVNEEELGAIRNSSLCAEGDLILADASEDMEDIGKCIEIINLNNERLVAGLHTILASPEKKKVSPGFGGHLFQSAAVRRQIQREAQGAKVLGISPRRLQDIGLPLSSLSEQEKIADCLDAVDALIAAQGRKVEALRAHKKGLMRQLFPQEGETQPRLRFPEFCNAGEWEAIVVSKLAKVTTGSRDTKNKVEGGKHPFFVRSQTIERIDSVALDCEAVLTSGDGVGVGKNFHYVNGKFDFHQRVYCIYDFKNCLSGKFFFYYFSEFFGSRVLKMSAKNSVDSVRMAMIADMPILLPSQPEQKRIANCLTSLDDLIAAETRKLDTLKIHKKGLMQQLFPSIREDDA